MTVDTQATMAFSEDLHNAPRHDASCHARPQEQQHEFDIVGHPRAGFSFVVVFPFHPNADGSSDGEVRLHPTSLPALLRHDQLSALTMCVMAWYTLCCLTKHWFSKDVCNNMRAAHR